MLIVRIRARVAFLPKDPVISGFKEEGMAISEVA